MTGRQFNPSANLEPGDSMTGRSATIVDVLSLPDDVRPLATWLLRQGEVSLNDVAYEFNLEPVNAMSVLESLMEQGFIQQFEAGGELLFRPRLSSQRQQRTSQEKSYEGSSSPLAIIFSPAGDYTIMPGHTFEVCVTVTNKGRISALITISLSEVSQTFRGWTDCLEERLALAPAQSGEVIFKLKVPPQALPAIYPYMIVVDAPQHYPEDTPVQYPQRLQILPAVEEAVKVSDPTFTLQPTTAPDRRVVIMPGQVMPFTLIVNNRTDRVDRFHLVCTDLLPDWFDVRYPENPSGTGLVLEADGLSLNPGALGQVTFLIKVPLDALAGNYVPTLRVYSDNNPDLVLLDLIYFQVPPNYNLLAELRTLVGKVKRLAGIYEVKFTNLGNTDREILVKAQSTDEDEVCEYFLESEYKIPKAEPDAETEKLDKAVSLFKGEVPEPIESETAHLKISPRQSMSVGIKVKPKKWWKRPFYGAGRIINFSISVEDPKALPLPAYIPQGTLIWEPRPWWQFWPLLFTGLLGLVAIALLIWWYLFRPTPSPKVVEFAAEDVEYKAIDGNIIRLNWRIANPDRIQTLRIQGLAPDGSIISTPITYDFRRGIPDALKDACVIEEFLICRGVRTDARRAGDYVFELTMVPKWTRTGSSLETVKTATVKILPIAQAKLVEFTSTQPVYQEVSPMLPDGPESLPADAGEPTGDAAPASAAPAGVVELASAAASTSALPAAAPATPDPTLLTPAGILLNWKVENATQLRELRLIGRSPEGTVVSPVRAFDFSQGIPKDLAKLCTIQEEILFCQNVPTSVVQPGAYTFEMAIIPKLADGGEPPAPKKTERVTIKPAQLQIAQFRINGRPAPPKFLIDLAQQQRPTNLLLTWRVVGGKDTIVELLPAPGPVPLRGSLSYPISQKIGVEVLTLQVSNAAGEKVSRMISIETFDSRQAAPAGAAAGAPPPAPPAAPSPTAPAAPAAPNINQPAPADPGSLSPSEAPPQFN